jgi:hypothetical protein
LNSGAHLQRQADERGIQSEVDLLDRQVVEAGEGRKIVGLPLHA